MPPIIKANTFHTLFARLFLIASCSLIRESCSAKASGFVSASILDPSNRLTGTSKISASFINRSESGTERPFSHFETVCLTTFNERDQKRARYAIQHISIYFNYIGKFENEVTQLAEPTEQEIRQMREEIEEAKKEKSRAYHRQYSREYRARNLEKQREYDRMKAREYRARRKAQAAAAQPAQ